MPTISSTLQLICRVVGLLVVWLAGAAWLVFGDTTADAQDANQSGAIYWGANIKGWPGDPAAIDAFESGVGKRVSIVHWGQPWANHGVEGKFQTSYFQTVRDRGSIPLLDWGSWDECCKMDQPAYQLTDIANGSHDAYLTRWAQAAHAWGKPFFLRFDWEMNGWWVPWSVQVNNNSPDGFVQAWRHIVDVFRAQGASNVSWVWCPNVGTGQSAWIADVYPGDDYVDWTCLDGYNWAGTQSQPWASFADIFRGGAINGSRNSYQAVLNVAPSKPMMIGETASAESGGSKADWITSALAALPRDFPQIRAFVWFDRDLNNPQLQWPIETSSAAKAAFAAGIASSTYAANQFGLLDTSPIPAPEAAGPASSSSSLASSGSSLARVSPSQDAFVRATSPRTNFGTTAHLEVGGSTRATTYMSFDLTPLAGATVLSATLHVKVASDAGSGSKDTQRLMLVADTGWQAASITYAKRAAVSGTQLGTLSGTADNQWYDVLLDAQALQPSIGGPLSLAFESDGSDGLVLGSTRSGNPPVLLITYVREATATEPVPVPAVPAPPTTPAVDTRFFDATRFRVDDDRIWSLFASRGGVDVFGYPVSRTFTFLGCRTQIFQRQVAQVCDDGQPRLLNLLDPDLFPYTDVNGSALPPPDDVMKASTPSIDDPSYATAMLGFIQDNVPDTFDGMPVGFGQTFSGLVTADVAGVSDPTLLGLINLEVWGAPISHPTTDPTNDGFVYQRFQRGIMHYDASTGVTRGLLLADYLKAILVGEDVPPDLDQQAQGGRLYHQYCPTAPTGVCRPDELPATDLRGAFDAG